jgi:ABC-type multidrug transport system ATPase subunit
VLLELDSVSKRYGSVRALDRVSLSVAPGQLVAVLGANGAGKTTFLRLLAGVAAPDHGTVRFDQEPFRREDLGQRRRFFFLPDFPPLFPDEAVLRNLALILRLYEADRPGVETRLVELLRDFDLLTLADAPVATLSRGQIYKVALVALLAVDPELWLLDEPLASGMDPHGLSAFKRHTRDAVARGRTVIYTTQVLDLVERFSDRVCLLHEGEVRAFAPVDELRSRAGGDADVLERLFQQLREETQ